MLGDAADELKKINQAKTDTQSLRERWESDYGTFRNELFKMPESEGEWDSWTSNRPSTTALRIITTLASARLKLWIPLSQEDEKKRKHLSKTEAFPYGVFALRDSMVSSIPGVMRLHDALCAFAPLRGWVVVLCYLEEEKKGKVKPHIQVWDSLNTYWAVEDEAVSWAAHLRTNPLAAAQEQDTKEGGKSVATYDIWDKDEHGILVGTEYKEKVKHGLDHVPVFIKAGGAIPFIQSETYEDTIKNLGESWMVNNRHLYEVENRMGSYSLTMAGRTAKTPLVLEFDSTKSLLPLELEGSPFKKGSVIPLDKGKGQNITSLVPPQATKDFYAFFEYLKTTMDTGDMAPVSFNQLFQPQTAAGMNLLRKLSELNVMGPKRLVEDAYVWMAGELISQYKSGPFKTLTLSGEMGNNRRFRVDVSPKEIDDQWQFEAKLLAEYPADEMANMGMAIQAKQAKLLSTETIQDKLLNVADTDEEQMKIDREEVFNVVGIKLRKLAADLADPERGNDPEGAAYIIAELNQMQAEIQQAQPGIAPQPGVSSAVTPTAQTVASPEQGKFRAMLSRLGGGGR